MAMHPRILKHREIEPLTRHKVWRTLESHYRKTSGSHLKTLFARDPKRGERFAVEAVGLNLDYSKNRITDETLRLLMELVQRINVPRGEKVRVVQQNQNLNMNRSTDNLIRR